LTTSSRDELPAVRAKACRTTSRAERTGDAVCREGSESLRLAEGSLSELQKRLGGDQLFVLEGDLQANPDDWPGFRDRFRIIQKLERQLVVSSQNSRHPSECLRDLLELPVRVENVTLKRPSLNDVFLQLTGRELRE